MTALKGFDRREIATRPFVPLAMTRLIVVESGRSPWPAGPDQIDRARQEVDRQAMPRCDQAVVIGPERFAAVRLGAGEMQRVGRAQVETRAELRGHQPDRLVDRQRPQVREDTLVDPLPDQIAITDRLHQALELHEW